MKRPQTVRPVFRQTGSACLLTTLALSPLPEGLAFDWQTGTPESQGFSTAKLEELRDSLAKRSTKALLVIRNDRIVCEWYASGHSAKKKHYTASMAKALVGGVALAVAVNDRRIALDDPAATFVPQWRTDPVRSRITIRQLGSHTSGLEDAEADGLPHKELTGWKGDFWKRPKPPQDPFTVARDLAPVVFAPGTDYAYSNPGIAMLGYALTAALKDAPEKDLRSLLRERVMRPIGVPDNEWSIGYGQTVNVDGLPLVGAWGGGGFTARAAARVGRLMLSNGDWDGRRLISAEAVRQTVSHAGLPGHNGMPTASTVAVMAGDSPCGIPTLRHGRPSSPILDAATDLRSPTIPVSNATCGVRPGRVTNPVSRGIGHLRCTRAVGAVDHRIFHGALGCGAGGNKLLALQVDECGRPNRVFGVFGQ